MDTSRSQHGGCATLSILADHRTLLTDGISNRQFCRVESRVTRWKQKAASHSIRHKTRGNKSACCRSGWQNYRAKTEEVAAA